MRQAYILAIALLIGLTTASASFSAPAGMNIILGKRQIQVASSPVTIDGKLFVPLDVVTALGASYVSHENGKTVSISRSEGQTFSLPTAFHGGRTLVSLIDLAKSVGASPDWQSESRTLRLMPLISDVDYADGQLSIRSTYPVQFKGRLFEGLKVFAIDVSPARIDTPTREIAIGEGNALRARVGQFSADTVRIAVDLKQPGNLAPSIGKDINVITVPIAPKPAQSKPVVSSPKPADAPKSAPAKATTPVAEADKPVNSVAVASAAEGVRVNGVKFEPGEQDKCKLLIDTTGRPAARPFVLHNPDRLVIDLIGSRLDDSAAQDMTISHPVVQAIRVAQFQDKPDITRVVMDLTRRITFSIMQPDESQIVVEMGSVTQQGLAGSIIVIDPGHGGSQPGALSPDKACVEKDINLAVSRRLNEILQAAGATVVMTRYGDTTMGLVERPRVANELNANVFISLHCNSVGVPNKVSGIETYYHKSDPVGRQLASLIQSAVVAETGMVDRGPRSDTRIAPNAGFSVLRNATVPAVLLEMGYLDHASDRKKLVNPEYQQKIAQGILNGLRMFLEGEDIGSSGQTTENDAH